MLDPISLVDPNKLLLPISFKSISTKPKPRFKKTLFPEFLKFQKFLRLRQQLLRKLLRKLFQSLESRLIRLTQKMVVLTQMTKIKKTLRPSQPAPSKLSQSLPQAKPQKFYKTNTKNSWTNTRTSWNQTKSWNKKWKTSKKKQRKRLQCQTTSE